MQKQPKRFRDHDLRRIYREEKAPNIIYTPGEIIGRHLLEQTEAHGEPLYLVYDLEQKGFVQPSDPAKVWTEWRTETEVYRPLPKLPWRPLPLPRLEPVSAEQLYREIRQYIYTRVDFAKDVEYDLATAWVMHTWRMENWFVTPYLFFFGPPASGKTWAMEVLASISYRPLFSMMSPAALYYATQDLRPTLFMDESEIYVRGKDKSDIINYLNAGYRRGQVVTRVEENSKTGQRQLKMFEVFSPKCLAGTRAFMGALQTRLIPFTMSRATREVEMHIDQEVADDLRAKLFAYRLNTLASNREPLIIQNFLSQVKDGRLRELFYPLIETVQTQKERALFVDYAVQTEKERREEEALSLESIVFSALVSCHENMEDKLLISFHSVLDKVILSQRESLSPQLVGRVIKKLGFKKRRLSEGVMIIWDDNIAERLSKRYPVIALKETPEDKDLKPEI